MGRPLTWQQVAELYLHHPEPASDAARQLVRRMVQRGMPCVPGRRGGLFFGDQVESWLREQAERASKEAEAERRAPRRGGRRRRRTPPKASTPIRERVAELRASLEDQA